MNSGSALAHSNITHNLQMAFFLVTNFAETPHAKIVGYNLLHWTNRNFHFILNFSVVIRRSSITNLCTFKIVSGSLVARRFSKTFVNLNWDLATIEIMIPLFNLFSTHSFIIITILVFHLFPTVYQNQVSLWSFTQKLTQILCSTHSPFQINT